MDGRACYDIVSRCLKWLAWIQFDDIQLLLIEETIMVIAQEMDGTFDDHADFRSWSDDGERDGFRFSAICHRMVEKNLRQSHVMIMMAMGDEQIVEIARCDTVSKHTGGGAEACIN